jgi:DNA-binding MarR family transcriptional regulator
LPFSIIDFVYIQEGKMPETDSIHLSYEIHTYAALLLKFFNEAVVKRLANSGVTLSSLQYSILQMLQNETLTISTISQRLGMDPSYIMRIIDVLEQKGLAVRGVDPHDRRRNPIQITEKGLELVTAVPVISPEDLPYQALQSLGEERLTQLRNLLSEVMQQFPDGRMISAAISGRPGTGMELPDAMHQKE